jgi:CheY-like chemotaxis protein
MNIRRIAPSSAPRGTGRVMATPLNGKRILLVDDERAIADSLAFMLSHEGYDVKAVYSGGDAIDTAKQFKPELLITDVVMPGISGTEAAISISKFLPECKTLLFSGQVKGKELAESARSQGFNFELIEKPLHPQELLQKIRSSFH